MPRLSPFLVLFLLMLVPKGINTAPIGTTSSPNLQSDIDSLKGSVEQINDEVSVSLVNLNSIVTAIDLHDILEDLQDSVNGTAARQLQSEMSVRDQRILDLEQRDYIERCESGSIVTPEDALSTDWTTGHRRLHLTATFSRAFRTIPTVTIGLTQVDHLFGSNTRVLAQLSDATRTSLAVEVGTWGDSILYSATVHWMACA
uniref:H-type lectin domain-containing protein n=1 Tax=Branchiostoma floridae TaxID=7739 RepID=C3YUW1_BRAFL|eukprot:XP_002600000.1 hypothetical protein BRAFLDRAFT_74119 [Branchiostoma floridae]